jgi:hypothetical protein
MFNPFELSSDGVVDESALLDIYKQSIPPEFDIDVIQLERNMRLERDKVIFRSGLMFPLAQNAVRGDYSRCMFENAVIPLARKHGLNAGLFKSRGGTFHAKISTDKLVITVHTLGDQDGNLSRFTEYKRNLSRNNPSPGQTLNEKSNKYFHQGNFFIDDDIGFPKIPSTGFLKDERIYFTICVPRMSHQRKNIFLVVPTEGYLDSFAEFKYEEIRDTSLRTTEIMLFSENIIESKQISLKDKDLNTIAPKKIDLGREEDEKKA